MTSEIEKVKEFLSVEFRDYEKLTQNDIEIILKDHEKALRFDKFVAQDDFAKAHDCNICGDKISYQIDKNSSQNIKSASMGWICTDCENNLKKKQEIMIELKDILELFDERRENYHEKELIVLVDEIVKIVWDGKKEKKP